MKCEHSEQLIPLYIGGDLEPPEAETLRRHLETCTPCRQLHEEFAASHTWLSEFAAPDFNASIYADLSASVIRKIEQQEKRGSWFQWLLPKWNPRLMLAASAAALAVVTGLMAITYSHKEATVRTGVEKLANSGKPMSLGESPSQTPVDSTVTQQQRFPASSARFSERAVKPAVPETQLPPEAFLNDPFATPLEESVTTSDLAEAALAEPEEREMLRIELQTADPNIRIIWLTPKAALSEPNTK